MALTDADRMAAAQLAIDRYHKVASTGAIRPDKVEYYIPPADWINLGTPGDSEIRLLLSDAAGGEYCFYFEAYSPSDTITVDWGDGNSDVYTGSTTYYANHAYTIGAGKSCSRGYTQFKCCITVSDLEPLYAFRIVGAANGAVQQVCGVLGISMNILLYKWSSPFSSCVMLEYFYSHYSSIFPEQVDVFEVFAGTYIQKVYFKSFGVYLDYESPAAFKDIMMLPVTLVDITIESAYSLLTNMVGAFKNYTALKKVVFGQCQDVSDCTELFSGCTSLRYAGLYYAVDVQDVANMFNGCVNLKNFRLFTDTSMDVFVDEVEIVDGINIQGSITSAVNIASMFTGCINLETIEIGTNLSAYTDAAFNQLTSLRSIRFIGQYGDLYSTTPSVSVKNNPRLRYVDIQNFPTITSASGLFENNPVLKTLKFGLAPSGELTDMSYLYRNDENLTEIIALNNSYGAYCTNASGLFYNCQRLTNFVDEIFGAAQQGAGTDMSEAFVKAYSINTITLPSCAITRIDVGCDPNRLTKLSSLIFSVTPATFSGTAPQINITYCDITAAELNALFSSLPELTGKVIDITGCSGAASCDQSIATTKGWTVII